MARSRPRCASRRPPSTAPPRGEAGQGCLAGLEFLGLPPREDARLRRFLDEERRRRRECGRVPSLRSPRATCARCWTKSPSTGRQELLWDYTDVSSAVASGLERRALTGFVLQDGLRSVAYCYYMLDAGRAIVGSLFAAAGFRGQGFEETLLDAVLADAQSHPSNDRVECQTLFSTAGEADGRFARAGFQSRVRHYLVRPLDEPVKVPEHRWRLRALRREDLAPAAIVIHASHRGSLDAALNLTYATPWLLPRVRGDARPARGLRTLRSGCLVPGRGSERDGGRHPLQPPVADERPRLPGVGRARSAGQWPRARCS